MDYLYSKFDPTDEKENYHVQEDPLFVLDIVLNDAVAHDEEDWKNHSSGDQKIVVEVLEKLPLSISSYESV